MTHHPINNNPKQSSTVVQQRVFIILNPIVGHRDADTVQRVIEQGSTESGWAYQIYHTTGDRLQDRAALRAALHRGCKRVIVAGGDGTILDAANELVGTDIPLGIIPLGTGNVLAHELNIPLDDEAACHLAVTGQATKQLDVMKANEQVCVSHLSVGDYSLLIKDTSPADKRRLGRGAYLQSAFKQMRQGQQWSFTIEVDGQRHQLRAALVLVANVGTVGITPFRWGPEIRPDDGQLNICIIAARSWRDYFDNVTLI